MENNLGLTTFGKPARGRIGANFRKPEPGLADRANGSESAQSRSDRLVRNKNARVARLRANLG